MKLTDPFENQYFKVGKVPKLGSVHAIALYDPADGKIIHMHRILNMEGATPVDTQEAEKKVLEFVRTELKRDTTKLNVIHDPNLKDISAHYNVNAKEKNLLKIPESEIQKKLKDLQKGTNK
jgi:hypothetical protein